MVVIRLVPAVEKSKATTGYVPRAGSERGTGFERLRLHFHRFRLALSPPEYFSNIKLSTARLANRVPSLLSANAGGDVSVVAAG